MEAIILTSVCGSYTVKTTTNLILTCKPRGLFRHQKIKPVVGDIVEVSLDGTINDIYPRKNYLIRPRIANIDELAIVMSLAEPDFSSLLIDKFLAYANYFNLKANIIISKSDLKSLEKVESKIADLRQSGHQVIVYSKVSKDGVEEIKNLFAHKVVALMGQTGVGKSSLLNCLVPQAQRDIGEYSCALGRGKHQTKEVVLIPYLEGYIADTPGFSSLELPLFKEDLAKCFPGFGKYYASCQFHDCLHLKEVNCAIKEALKNKDISEESYENYQKILQELPYRKDRF